MSSARPDLKLIHGALRDEPPEAAAPALPLSFPVVYRQNWRYVARIANRLLGPHDEDVDDVIQEVFLIALRKLHKLEDPGALRGWLASITVRRVSRKLRMRRLRAVFLPDEADEMDHVAADAPGPEDRSMMTSAFRALDRLPANHRIAWTLRHVEEEPLETVASMCGCSLATAKRWIAAAQESLKQDVRRESAP